MTTSSPSTSPSTRPIFEPVSTTFPSAPSAPLHDDVESPSLTNGNALARFEFEPGRSKEGTKVLMVEWEEDETTKDIKGDWELSWEGKKTVLSSNKEGEEGEAVLQPVNRLYFLLGPGVAIPTAVQLKKRDITWRTNPLPAIFSPELGATARQAGKKGVLHTIWAKKRLQVLQREIEVEEKENVEGIGLEMAAAEKEWIEQNFGVQARPQSLSVATGRGDGAVGGGMNNPTTPRSPGGGRLMDKLKGLKIGTSAQELSTGRSEAAPQVDNYHNPLSPESSDVAVGGFGSFAALKGAPHTSTLAAKPPQTPSSDQQQQRQIVAQPPPTSFLAQQWQQQHGGMASLNAFASGDVGMVQQSSSPVEDTEDELFALPISPRSPEMSKSPFSFALQDTGKYKVG